MPRVALVTGGSGALGQAVTRPLLADGGVVACRGWWTRSARRSAAAVERPRASRADRGALRRHRRRRHGRARRRRTSSARAHRRAGHRRGRLRRRRAGRDRSRDVGPDAATSTSPRTYTAARAVLPPCCAAGSGRVVLIASRAVVPPAGGFIAYTVAKAGIDRARAGAGPGGARARRHGERGGARARWTRRATARRCPTAIPRAGCRSPRRRTRPPRWLPRRAGQRARGTLGWRLADVPAQAERLGAALARRRLDALIAASPANVAYVTGFSSLVRAGLPGDGELRGRDPRRHGAGGADHRPLAVAGERRGRRPRRLPRPLPSGNRARRAARPRASFAALVAEPAASAGQALWGPAPARRARRADRARRRG